jgi:DNA-binding LytR/AlgR family response regulator
VRPPIKAIIADDEPLLRRWLADELQAVWPELDICAQAENGMQALELIAARKPQIAFLDIRMPGLSGLEVARRAAPSCRIVFITAFDQFAVQAFEQAAMDYLLKPVERSRLELTVARLRHSSPRPPGPCAPPAGTTVENRLAARLAAMDQRPGAAAAPLAVGNGGSGVPG